MRVSFASLARSARLARAVAAIVSLPAVAVLTGCSGTGQPAIDYPAFAVSKVPGPIEANGFTITLDEALVAFGPAYFCASMSAAATLCDAAIAEITETTTIDALNPDPQPLGTVEGFTGQIRSASHDYGVSWFLTEIKPKAAQTTPSGHSARFRGRAERDGVSVSFTADIDATPQERGQRFMTSKSFPEVTITEESAASVRLEVHLDIASWLAAVAWDAAVASGGEPYTIASDSPEHNAVVTRMQDSEAGSPSFVWTTAP